MEPDWEDFERRLAALTVRELRELGREHFGGCLGGASAKREVARGMATQAAYWWRSCGDGGRDRVRRVMAALGEVERG